jgi:tetratricopeptide (TPR) repeat protein
MYILAETIIMFMKISGMGLGLGICILFTADGLKGQQPVSAIDGLAYGVVLDDPRTASVKVKLDVPYYKNDSLSLHIDVYSPPAAAVNQKLPAIIFLNAVGDVPNERKVKSWAIYTSWPKLMAAQGYIGISMESERNDVLGSIRKLFDFLKKEGGSLNINTQKIGVYAASANVGRAIQYLMSKDAYAGIRAAVMYYGSAPEGPYRKDLPVYFVVSESDVARNSYSELWSNVLKNNAPWTLKMGTDMPHAFDAFKDNDDARIIIKETISFWKNHLDKVEQPSWKPSIGREILSYLYSEPSKALGMLQQYTSEHPDDERAMYTYAEVLFREKRYDESNSAFGQLLKRNPQHLNAMIQLAAMSYAMNKPAEAEEYINRAVKTGKMTAQSYSQLGFALLVANKNDEAAKYYELAVSTQPRGVDYYNLACAYAKNQHREKAIAALDKAVAMGYGTRSHISTDADLNSIRDDERYKKIVEKIR